jgi:methyl-accepting chemotaxis protein
VGNLSSYALQMREGVERQRADTDQVATAINQMSATIQEVASNAAKAEHTAAEADERATQGRDVVSENTVAIETFAEEVDHAAQVIHKLEQESEGIGAILDVIRGIADQTNLLALNAAIEAARAGEQGRGFAVVADEVRSLAQKTQQSTEEIQKLIEQLQAGAGDAVTVVESQRERASESVIRAEKVHEVLQDVSGLISAIKDMNMQIASAAEEHSQVTEEVNERVVSIAKSSETVAEGAASLEGAAEMQNGHVGRLRELVAAFKIDS